MKKFNVGDIVKANIDYPDFPSCYDVTNEHALCKVVGTSCGDIDIEVEVIYHVIKSSSVGRKYTVKSEYFDLVIPANETSVKKMTVKEIEKELGYSIKVIKERG